MRLTPFQIVTIQNAFRQHFGKEDRLWLFGSRVDDKKKGGDIDLYIQTPELDTEKLYDQRSKFLMALYTILGEQKIDVVLHRINSNTDLPIYHVAQKTGILLMKEIVQGIFATCNIHAERMRWAMNRIQVFIPFTVEKIESLSPEDVAFIDLFTTRFSKLQDLMSAKLFPLIIDIIQEPNPPSLFIDILNRLEKREILPSAQQWIDFRRARNSFTHDYPDDSKENADALNQSFDYAPQLLKTLEDIKKFMSVHGFL